MNPAVYRTSERHASKPKRVCGLSVRGVAWVVLASWLFSWAMCSVIDFGFVGEAHGHSDNHRSAPAAHDAIDTGGRHHGGDTSHSAGVNCCTVMESPSLTSYVSNIFLSPQNPLYILFPAVVALQSIIIAASIRPHLLAYPPPTRSSLSLIANALWPNAPPR